MKRFIQAVLLLSAIVLPSVAQQQGVRQFVPGVQRPPEKGSTNNYRLELEMKRGDRMARYLIAFNSGSVNADLVDKLSSRANEEPRTSGEVNWGLDGCSFSCKWSLRKHRVQRSYWSEFDL